MMDWNGEMDTGTQEKTSILRDEQNISLLIQAVEASNHASAKLQEAYNRLQIKVQELNLELEEKNMELERNLNEKERMEKFLNNILESLTDGVMATDLDGRITVFNRSAENITGYRWKDVMGRNYTDVLGIDFFKDFPQTKSLKDWAMQFNEETEIQTKSKSMIPVKASLSQVRDENQEVTGILTIFRDLSVIKGLEEQVKRTNVLTAMGEMAANIAHEVRNPLASIQLFAEMLEDDLAGEPDKQELAKNIFIAVRNLNNTVSNLLLFTKEFTPPMSKVFVRSLVDESLVLAKHMIHQKDIILRIDLEEREQCVVANPELLKQVLMNLFLNAVQAMDDGGVLSIVAADKQEGGMDYTVISVKDTGNGILKKDMERIFNPFYTTKKRGTGLGLAISSKILEAHRGKITVESVMGKGSCFSVFLPKKTEVARKYSTIPNVG